VSSVAAGTPEAPEHAGDGAERSPGLNPTAASLLGFLHEGPRTGYALLQVADERIGRFWSLTRSQVYRELGALERRGLVRRGEEGPRASRPYALTDAGRDVFAAWVAGMPGDEQIRYPLLLTLAFGTHVGPDRLAAMVAAHRESHEARLASYREAEREHGEAIDPYRRATLAFGVRYEEAVLAWMDDLPAILGRPTT
jgi:DNA-binding PadR family transcriptional regulator